MALQERTISTPFKKREIKKENKIEKRRRKEKKLKGDMEQNKLERVRVFFKVLVSFIFKKKDNLDQFLPEQ